MAFQPYTIYKAELPRLRAGHFIQIGSSFYQVKTVRRNRQAFDFATTAEIVLNVTTNAIYEAMHGNIKVDRVTHLQYVSVLNTAPDVLLKWGTEPLLSRWRNIKINANMANRQAPLEIDRWSHDPEMRLSVTPDTTAAQTLYFETVEYEVVAWEKTPPKQYLKILPDGQATFMESG